MVQLAMISLSDPDALQRVLERVRADDVEISGTTALATVGGPLYRDREGRSAGRLAGTVFNDQELREQLAGRGLVDQGAAAGALACTSVAQFGPRGLASLRMQGVCAVLHRAQGMLLAAPGPAGVGPLYFCAIDEGVVASTDARLLGELAGFGDDWLADGDPPTDHWAGARSGKGGVLRVVAGSALMLQRGRARCERVRWDEGCAPFFRNPPAALREANVATAAALLADAIADAAAAAARNHGLLWLGPAHNRCQHWLRKTAQFRGFGEHEADAAWRWSMLGARTLGERMRWPQGLADAPLDARIERLQRARDNAFPPPATRPPLPMPLPGDDRERAGQRLLRFTVFSHAIAARAWQRAADERWNVAFPHLDPRVLAVAGALPREVLQQATSRPLTGEPPLA